MERQIPNDASAIEQSNIDLKKQVRLGYKIATIGIALLSASIAPLLLNLDHEKAEHIIEGSGILAGDVLMILGIGMAEKAKRFLSKSRESLALYQTQNNPRAH